MRSLDGEHEGSSELGVIDLVTERHLDALKHLTGLSFVVVIPSSALESLRGGAKKTAIVDASVNIMGPADLADQVGTALETASAYLQHPFYLAARIPYINPHWFYLDGVPTDLRHLVGLPALSSNSKRISDTILSALGSLDRPLNIGPAHFGARYTSNATSGCLLTPLRPSVSQNHSLPKTSH